MDPHQSLDLLEHFRVDATVTAEYTTHTECGADQAQGIRKEKVERRWHRVKCIGRGTFGVVWLEVNKGNDGVEKRAVKVINKSGMQHLKVDYKKELLALSKFSSLQYEQEGVFVKFFGWFEDSSQLFLSMEYFELGDLEQHIEEPLTEDDVRDITIDVLNGLRIMHSENFAHRDIKPGNIFVVQKPPTSNWWVKIGDFGISKRAQGDLTALRTQVGTLDYEAPEIRGYFDTDEPTSIYDNAVDMWSLGCVIYKIATRKVPFPKAGAVVKFCREELKFPEELLLEKIGVDGTEFVKTLIVPNPRGRLSAVSALEASWVLQRKRNTYLKMESSERHVSTIALTKSKFGSPNEMGMSSYAKEKAAGVKCSHEGLIGVADGALEGNRDKGISLSQAFDNEMGKLQSDYVTFSPDSKLVASGSNDRSVTPIDSPDRVATLSSLGHYLSMRFKRTGAMGDLERAIEVVDMAVAATPVDHPSRAAKLDNLGNCLGMRFKQIGAMSDLERAIEVADMAVAATPIDHPSRAARLDNLGSWLGMRFERTGEMSNLERAIEVVNMAVEATPVDHPDRAGMLSNLGNWLGTRYRRTGAMDDLKRAIEIIDMAVVVTPNDHPDRAGILSNLGNWLGTRYKRTGAMGDLERAIEIIDMAAVVTADDYPVDHPDRAGTSSNLGNRLSTRFGQTGTMSDLERAIKITDIAVATTPADHPDRAGLLNNLGNWLSMRFERTGDQIDIERSLSSFEAGWNCQNAQPSIRINLARRAATILASQLHWEESSKFLQNAVELLPTVSPRSLENTDKQYMLREFTGLASEAAAIALNAGMEAHYALKLLELGRSVISGLLLEMRSDISMLGEQHPELANEFGSLRDKLDLPVRKQVVPAPTDNTSQSNRFRVEQQFADVIARIRALSGFENFLLPPSSGELMEAAEPGPIIVINLSQYRCDAFLIERHQIRALRLPNLNQRDVGEKLQDLRSSRISGASPLRSILEWLWHAVAFPCLQALGLEQPPPNSIWPHVWWIPTGTLSHFPLHAAGLHRRNSTETVLDRVVSSYSPSVKSLLYVRQATERQSHNPSLGEVLLVSMQFTPGQYRLRFAEKEVEMLNDLLPTLAPRTQLRQAHKEAVLSHLASASIFHFAGHGRSDPNDPLKSCLLLSDWQLDPLTVGDLMSLNLHQQKPWLAYLSACSTGESQHIHLFDESLHLMNACQLAGFQHVIGSLWEVSDMYSVDAARVVYETVRDKIGTSKAVAWGVHQAARLLRRKTSPGSSGRDEKDAEPRNGNENAKLRETTSDEEDGEIGNPLIWAAYIHVGI